MRLRLDPWIVRSLPCALGGSTNCEVHRRGKSVTYSDVPCLRKEKTAFVDTRASSNGPVGQSRSDTQTFSDRSKGIELAAARHLGSHSGSGERARLGRKDDTRWNRG